MEIKFADTQIFKHKIMKKIISKSFYFEAAHKLNNTVEKENKNLHGHSYFVEIALIDVNSNIEKTGYILDFSLFNKKIENLRSILDHSYLNEIIGLENPTLENIGIFIYKKLKEIELNIYKIIVKRKSCGEAFYLEI